MKRLLAVIAVALLAGCSGSLSEPDAPDDLIGRDSMVIVMRELVVVESVVQTRYQNINTFYKVMSASGKLCLKKYHITPDRFERSYEYYVSREEELQSIYSEVIDSLTREANALSIKIPKSDDTLRVAPL